MNNCFAGLLYIYKKTVVLFYNHFDRYIYKRTNKIKENICYSEKYTYIILILIITRTTNILIIIIN